MSERRPKVGVFYIATQKYKMFWSGFKESCDKFCCTDADKTYYVFTDDSGAFPQEDNVVITKIEHQPWPGITIHRARILLSAHDKWKDMDCVMFCNSNMVFCNPMCTFETFGMKPLMACIHPCSNGGFSKLSLEDNPKSTAYWDQPTAYLAGGFQGGRTDAFAMALKIMDDAIKIDEENGIMAVWHDESHWNKLCAISVDQVHVLGWPTLYVQPHPWVKAWLIDKNMYWEKTLNKL